MPLTLELQGKCKMALRLTNFVPIGLDNPPTEIHINDEGKVVDFPIKGATTINAEGSYLSPGWCDLHVHIWYGGTDISVRSVDAGRNYGVTALADAGSAGEANFHGLREYVIDSAEETIRAFINIGSIGLVACNRLPELIDLRSIDIDRTLKVIEANRDIICGIKVRASGVIVGNWGIGPVRIAKRVAEISNLPLMVHVGEPPPLLDEILPLLTQGDIVTHCFNGKPAGSITDTNTIWRMAYEAAEQGVRMDIGHGQASFDFGVARDALNHGFLPFSISTDLHCRNIHGPVHDLALTISKLYALGMDLEDCITAVTKHPRSVLELPSREGAQLGNRADFTLFKIIDSNLEVSDSMGKLLKLSSNFVPIATIIGGSHLPVKFPLPSLVGHIT